MQPPGITGLSLLLSYEDGKICGRIVATSWIVHVRRQREKTVSLLYQASLKYIESEDRMRTATLRTGGQWLTKRHLRNEPPKS